MSETRADEVRRPRRPDAVILMFHGGKPRSSAAVDARSASWRRSAWMQRSIAARAHEARCRRVAAALPRTRLERRPRPASPTHAGPSTRCGRARATCPSSCSGTRWVRGSPSTSPTTRPWSGVVGLAPVVVRAGPRAHPDRPALVAAHGQRDRITSFGETARVRRPRAGGRGDASLRDMGPLGHYMLTGAAPWNDVAVESALRLLDPAAASPGRLTWQFERATISSVGRRLRPPGSSHTTRRRDVLRAASEVAGDVAGQVSARRDQSGDAPASPHDGVTTSRSPTSAGSRPSMSSQRSTRSVSTASEGTATGSVDGTTPSATVEPVVERLRQHVEVLRAQHVVVHRQSACPGTVRPAPTAPRGRTSAPTARRPRRRWRRARPRARRRPPAGATVRCRPKPEAVGTPPPRTAGSIGSSTCTISRSTRGSRRRRSATWPRTPSARAWASSRRAPWSESTLSPRGFSTVAASVHGPVTCALNAPAKSCACSSTWSRSWASSDRARRWSIAGRVGQPPARGLEVDAETVDDRERAAGHVRR